MPTPTAGPATTGVAPLLGGVVVEAGAGAGLAGTDVLTAGGTGVGLVATGAATTGVFFATDGCVDARPPNWIA